MASDGGASLCAVLRHSDASRPEIRISVPTVTVPFLTLSGDNGVHLEASSQELKQNDNVHTYGFHSNEKYTGIDLVTRDKYQMPGGINGHVSFQTGKGDQYEESFVPSI